MPVLYVTPPATEDSEVSLPALSVSHVQLSGPDLVMTDDCRLLRGGSP